MKTADLIPLILLELVDGDKYGLELTKNIENKSNAQIIIKQPTLYTVLKKLEKTKFITSYWVDSEIGGKRHYYKLTENGKIQASTLPSYDFLIQNLLAEPETEEETTEETKPVETVLPSAEIFADNSIDSVTTNSINEQNTDLLKPETTNADENFAINENVVKFTENLTPNPNLDVSKLTTKTENKNKLFDLPPVTEYPDELMKIKYVDYVNFKNLPEYQTASHAIKKISFSALITGLYLLVLVGICECLALHLKASPLFYVSIICAILSAIFFPLLIILNAQKSRLNFEIKGFSFNWRKSILLDCVALLFVLLICLCVNVSIGNNTFAKILNINNFANFYAQIILITATFLNTILKYFLLKKLNQKN